MTLDDASRDDLIFAVEQLESVLFSDVPEGLTQIEGRLFGALQNANGRTLTREQLIAAGWYDREPVTDDGIRHHIKRLRKKGYDIQPHYGIGYSMTPEFLRRARRNRSARDKLKDEDNGSGPRRTGDNGRAGRATDGVGKRPGSGHDRADGADGRGGR